jgi:hypothetical protein
MGWYNLNAASVQCEIASVPPSLLRDLYESRTERERKGVGNISR